MKNKTLSSTEAEEYFIDLINHPDAGSQLLDVGWRSLCGMHCKCRLTVARPMTKSPSPLSSIFGPVACRALTVPNSQWQSEALRPLELAQSSHCLKGHRHLGSTYCMLSTRCGGTRIAVSRAGRAHAGVNKTGRWQWPARTHTACAGGRPCTDPREHHVLTWLQRASRTLSL